MKQAMKRLNLFVGTIVTAACLSTPSYGVIVQLDESTLPTNPENGADMFTFEDLAAPGAVTTTASAIVLDVVDNPGTNPGVFGGVGVDFLQRDFDPGTADLEIRLRALANNAATAINIVYRDLDGAGVADEFHYQFDISSLTPGGGFVTLTQSLLAPGPLFSQGAYGYTPGDAVQNPGLDQLQIHSPWGATGRMNLEIDYVRIVPEPSSLMACVGLGCLGLIRRGNR